MKASTRFSEERREKLKYFLLLIPLAISLFAMANHEWWRDEANPWLIARASEGIGALMENVRFIGHPRLYYLIVYMVQHLTGMPMALGILNLFFMIAALWLFMSAPFPLIVRLLFALGYYPVYQYGVFVRSYSLLVFLLFLYAYLYVHRPRLEKSRLAVLALLAQVHLISLSAAGALLLFEVIDLFRLKKPMSARLVAVYLCVAASMILSIIQMLPTGTDKVVLMGANPGYLWIGITTGFVPGLQGHGHSAWQVWVGGIFFSAGLATLLGRWRDLSRYLLLVLSLLLCFSIVYQGFRWHFGFYMIFLVVCLWMSSRVRPFGPFQNIYLAILFSLHGCLMILAVQEDFVRPYSNGPAVAGMIHRECLEGLPMVGVAYESNGVPDEMCYSWEVDCIQPVMAGIPGKEALDPVTGEMVPYWGHYGDWNYFKHMNGKTLESNLELIRSAAKTDLLVIFVRKNPRMRLEGRLVPPSFLETVATFSQPFDFGEEMVLCKYPRQR